MLPRIFLSCYDTRMKEELYGWMLLVLPEWEVQRG